MKSLERIIDPAARLGQAQELCQTSCDYLEPVGVFQSLLRTIEQIEKILEQETSFLMANQEMDLRAINSAKSRALFDFNNLLKLIGPVSGAVADRFSSRLCRLKNKLEANSEALQLHLNAISELADFIRRALETQEDDGTYEAQALNRGNIR